MDETPDPHAAQQQIASMLEADDLPMFSSYSYDLETERLSVSWASGFTLVFELGEAGGPEPFDEEEREAIRNGFVPWPGPPIDITVPGSPDDPRDQVDIPGIRVHHVPELHPDDTAVIDGIPVTSPSRTLIDLAEVLPKDELRDCFVRARELDLLDPDALLASRARVEWRPSLETVDELIAEFCP